MTVFAVPLYPVFHGLDGLPLDGGSIYIGYAGQSAEAAPLPIYWDEARTIPAAQPVRTVNGYPDRNGSPASIYVQSDETTQDYSITVRDRSGRLVYTALQGLNLAQIAVESAWQAVQAASAFDGNGLWVNDATAFFDNTSFTYTTNQPGTVTAGQYIRSRKEGYSWRVAASGATDHHVTTAGGVKGYVDAPEVQPEMFGKITGVPAEDTAAILAAMELNRDVSFPGATYLISQSITLNEQRLRGLGKTSTRAQTLLVPQGNFPCFINPLATWNSCDIDGFFINYGEDAPVSASGNDQKIGFKFTGDTTWTENFRISNCTVRGAWYGFYDLSGSYMSIMDRVEARHCKFGFFKQGGTTIVYQNCFARGDGVQSEMGFFIREAISSTFISCAADMLKPGANAYANTANMFEGCPGVTIAGWDAETNDIAAGNSYMRFTDAGASVSVSGFLGYQNTLRAGTGQESTLVLFDGVNASFSGKMRFGSGDLNYIGTGGVPITIKAINSAKVFVSGSDMPAASGGTPGAAYAILGESGTVVSYTATATSGLVSGATELLASRTTAAPGNAPIFAARAWVNFNGTNASIRGSGNVASVVRNGLGDYTINFTTAMPDANYCVSGSGDQAVGASATIGVMAGVAPTTTSVRVRVLNSGNANFDPAQVHVAIIR